MQELQEYRLNKRKEFEDLVRRVGRWSLNIWVKVEHIPSPACHLCDASCLFVVGVVHSMLE